MNASQADVQETVPGVTDRLIRFEAPEEFRGRPEYRENLSPQDAKPFRIIGGYGFKKAKWLHCGFSNCKTLHGNGYVIRNAAGLETNIGHCCGKTMFGADWHAMFEQFQTERKAQTLQDVLTRVLASREGTLKQAAAAHAALLPAAERVRSILNVLESYGPIKRAFWDCIKQRGSLAYYRETTESERAYVPSQRSVRETKGNIDGWHAATVDAKELARRLKFSVIVPLSEIEPEVLRHLQQRQLEARLREFSDMAAIVQQAEVFAEDAAKLGRPINWHRFEQFCDASKVRMDHQGYKALRSLAGTA